MTKSTPCPRCGTTMWVGSLHICRAEQRPDDLVQATQDGPHPAIRSKRLKSMRAVRAPRPGSRMGTTIALWVFVMVVGLVAGWALNSVFGVFK